jgi:hypothetical protein
MTTHDQSDGFPTQEHYALLIPKDQDDFVPNYQTYTTELTYEHYDNSHTGKEKLVNRVEFLKERNVDHVIIEVRRQVDIERRPIVTNKVV